MVESSREFSTMERCIKTFERWAAWSSLHGLAWHNRTSSTVLKLLVALFAVVILACLVTTLVLEAIDYAKDDTIRNAVEWKTARTMTYPNLTVCNPKYFAPELLKKYRISNELASYMLIPLDASMKEYIKFMKRLDPNGTEAKLQRLDEELNNVLKENNLNTTLDLFHATAIQCEQFVTFCEDHKNFYSSTSFSQTFGGNDSSCCSKFFNQEPYFTAAGTCYTTNSNIVETFPSVYSSIRIWLFVNETHSPRFDMSLLGSDAVEKKGVKWVLSHKEHPARVLAATPEKSNLKSSTLVGITKEIIDRNQIKYPCLVENATFKEIYNLEQTQLNCHLFGMSSLLSHCSLGLYSGWKPGNDSLLPCSPRDVLFDLFPNATAVSDIDNLIHSIDRFSSTDLCPYDCIHIRYHTKVTQGEIDTRSLASYLPGVSGPVARAEAAIVMEEIAEQSALLHFYFDSFEYPTYSLYRLTIMDFLSKVGGWMSLAVGASIISGIELIGFSFHFLYSLLPQKDTKNRGVKGTNNNRLN